MIGIVSGSQVYLWGAENYGQNPWNTRLDVNNSWPLNWALDKVNNKFSFEFYLDNDLEEVSPTVIYDDDESFWSKYTTGTGSYDITLSEETTEKQKGTSSLKMVVGSGSASGVGIQKTYGSGQDWSAKEFLCLIFYGANSGETWRFIIRSTVGNYNEYRITDNFTGWKRFVLPLNDPNYAAGSLDLSNVTYIKLCVYDISSTPTNYLDRTVVDVGQWVLIEVYTPDALKSVQDGVNVYTDDGGGQHYKVFTWNPNDVSSYAYTHVGYYMDGTDFEDVFGAVWSKGVAFYEIGERGETPAAGGGAGSPPALTYSSYYGCLKRIGFALKMCPDDGQDSSTDGISQCKLKLEVYYADSLDPAGVQGQTTYEFKNDSNQYYGLTNWKEPWIVLFDATLKRAWYLIFSDRPTGLKVCADEDEYIHWIEATLPAGCRVFAGELCFDDVTKDSSGNGVPDFLSEGLPVNEVDPIEIYDDDETFWGITNEGSGSIQGEVAEDTTNKIRGTSCANPNNPSGSYASWYTSHSYGSGQDFSAKEYICIWIKGSNSGETVILTLGCPNWSNKLRWNIVDNFTGWKEFIFGLADPDTTSGSPDLSDVQRVYLNNVHVVGADFRWDRLIVDVGKPSGIPHLSKGVAVW